MYERLAEAFERGLKGAMKKFYSWLEGLGINSGKFSLDEIEDFLRTNPEATVDRVQELETIAEYMGYYSRKKSEVLHIPILGVSGSGRTHILRVIFGFSSNVGMRALFMDAAEFSEVEAESQRFEELLEEVHERRPDILIVDNCETDANIKYSLRELIRAKGGGILIITSWCPVTWEYERDDVEEIVETTEEVFLHPFSPEKTFQLISKITSFISDGKLNIPRDICDEIHRYSMGIPRVAITLFFRSFRESFRSGGSGIDLEAVRKAAGAMGLLSLDELLNRLSDMQLLVLKHIILSGDPRGIRPIRLVEILNRDKATISYHLEQLLSGRVVTRTKLGRFAFYRIRKDLLPFVQLKLYREGEFYRA